VWLLPGLEALAAALFGGSRLGGARSRFLPNYYQFPIPSERSVTTGEGVRFRVDVGTLLGWCLRFDIRDPALEAYFDLVTPGATVVDIGANIGFTALTAGRRVGDGGTVLAFEPHPDNLRALRTNVALNPELTVRIIDVALGAEEGEAQMTEHAARNPGGHRISAEAGGHTVRVRTLDSVLAEYPELRPDLIKIDTEGFEAHVLPGARETLRRHRPVVFLELSDGLLRAQGSSTGSIVRFLHEEGYSVRDVLDDREVDPDADHSGTHFDAVCRPLDARDTR